MAASFECSILSSLTGLGQEVPFNKKGSDETTPTAGAYHYSTIVTADTAQALDLGDVSTVTGIILYAIDYDVLIDLDFVSAFDVDQTAKAAGIPVVITYPAGTVYVQGESGQTPKFEYIVWGTT